MNTEVVELPKLFLDKIKYLASRQGIGFLQLLSEWQRLSLDEGAMVECREILRRCENLQRETTNWGRFKIGLEIDLRIIRHVPRLLTEIGPEFRETDLDTGLPELIDKLVELGGGVLRLPTNVVIDFSNPRDALAELELLLRDEGKEDKKIN